MSPSTFLGDSLEGLRKHPKKANASFPPAPKAFVTEGASLYAAGQGI